MKTAPSLFCALSLFCHPLTAQDAASPSASEGARLELIGAATSHSVFASHMAVNSLGDAWMKQVYTDEVALSLASTYETGLGNVNDKTAKLIEVGAGLSAEDLNFLSECVECGRLVVAQITALKGYINTGEEAKAKIFEAKRLDAQKRIFALMGIDGGEAKAVPAAPSQAPNRLEFEIVEAALPQGGPGQKGKVVFTRTSPDRAYTVSWQYADGKSDTGLAVAFPGSNAIAVGFGPDVLGVAIYQLDGKNVDARWAPYVEDAEIGSYTMTQGENDAIYTIEGEEEGTFHYEEFDEGTAKLAWKYPSGELAGYGVAVDNHLAAVSVKPGGKSGVAIYIAKPESSTAEGRWTLETTLGTVGKETYRFITAE